MPGHHQEFFSTPANHRVRITNGLQQTVLSTDYRFPSVAEAADTLGFFFGEAMARAVRAALDAAGVAVRAPS